MGIEQKVAIITGASQGIGAALVQGFRNRNYRIVATARTIKPSGDDKVHAVAGDIAERSTAERVVAEAVARFGRVADIVEAVLYLEGASFVTGEILHVDGGQSAGH